MDQHTDFDYSAVPPTWAVCFIADCPLAAGCLKHFAGEHIPADRHFGSAVYSTALENGKCTEFKQMRIMHGAWGFNTIFAEVKRKDNTPLRDAIKNFLGGHGTYYRYHHGEHLLTPEQQEWIVNLFRSNGYADNLVFDHYQDAYDFS